MRWASLMLVLAACGTDRDPGCPPTVTYQTVGAPFVESWCRGCHSIDATTRQRAPADVNFDTLDEIRGRLFDVDGTISERTIPPAGGPSDAERTLMTTWLRCGAP